MKALITTVVTACIVLAASDAQAICGKKHPHSATVAPAFASPTAPLPPDAVIGECYARVITPAAYRDVVEQVVKREATETVRMIPARYEQRTEELVVTPATTRTIDVPAQFTTVDREVEVEPARQEWRRGACNPKAVVDNATGECWCLVEVPPVMKTVHEQVVSVPASTRTVNVPAVYETVAKRVMIEPEREEHTPVPAVIENVTRRELVTPEKVTWVKIPCEAGKAEPASNNDLLSFTRLDNRVH